MVGAGPAIQRRSVIRHSDVQSVRPIDYEPRRAPATRRVWGLSQPVWFLIAGFCAFAEAAGAVATRGRINGAGDAVFVVAFAAAGLLGLVNALLVAPAVSSLVGAASRFLFELSQHITVGRWIVLCLLMTLCVQSLLLPLELLHSYHLSIASAWGCAVVLSRDSDIFVARAWLPYPLFIGVAMLQPVLAWRRVCRPRRKAG